MLKKIKDQENHLLIGNGFNQSLGINTSYKAIFEQMIENNKKIYIDAVNIVKKCNFDLEKFIGKLKEDIADSNKFLKKYVQNKVKFDFMKATHEIVKSEIKNVYAEKNKGIFILFKNFTNYFTLNYDSFLYLFLLKYKSTANNKNNTIALPLSLEYIKNDLNYKQKNIYKEIKSARENGKFKISLENESDSMEKPLKNISKTHLVTILEEYSKGNNKGWSHNDIDRVVVFILKEERKNKFHKEFDDGSRPLSLFNNKTESVFIIDNKTQNLFFLHGAFHIFKDGNEIKKITQQTDKALYDKLEETLNSEKQEIVCVFQDENKIDVINKNKYLQKCFNKLGEISGNLVIIGSSLSENDNHIFNQINNSKVNTIYISSFLKEKEKVIKVAKEKFPSKNIYLFDADTISYEQIDENYTLNTN